MTHHIPGVYVRETLPSHRNRFRHGPLCGDYMARWREPEPSDLTGVIKWCAELVDKLLHRGHTIQSIFVEETKWTEKNG